MLKGWLWMEKIDIELEKKKLRKFLNNEHDYMTDYEEEVIECYEHLISEFKPNGKEGMFYSEIGEILGLCYEDDLGQVFEINERNALAHILGLISSFEVDEGRPMLSAIVVRHNNRKCGKGFFDLAETLHQIKKDETHEDFWDRTIKDLRKTWKPQF